jgi:hypothetical protein
MYADIEDYIMPEINVRENRMSNQKFGKTEWDSPETWKTLEKRQRTNKGNNKITEHRAILLLDIKTKAPT